MEHQMSCREEIGVPANSLSVDVDGVRLAVAREGRGPTLICLHAIGHGGGDFEVFATAVKERFQVIRIDWPGQGRSATDSKPPGPSRYAQLLAGVVDQLKIERPIILGNSIGGAAALIYASRYPVRALVLCDTGGLVPVNTTTRTFCGIFARFFAAGERRAWWFRPAFRAYYRFLVLPSPAAVRQRDRIIEAGYEIAPLLREAWTGFGRPEADIRHLATALEIPVWFAWAKRDRVIPLAACMPCIRQMKTAHLSKFDAGHSAFLEQPDEFIREFLRFAEVLEETAAMPQMTRRAQ
jgi:pimeloyl-ACP methyl ester carboxylesterase